MTAIFKRELRSYFTTPLAYVFLGVFLAASGLCFSLLTMLTTVAGSDSDTSSYFSVLMYAFVVLIPLLTMKSFAEERKSKTEQLILTSKVSLPGMVIGKFLAAFSVFGIGMLLSCLFFSVLNMYGAPNKARLFGSVLSLFLIGAAFISIGLFISALTKSQLVAAIGTIAVLLAFLTISLLKSYIDSSALREVINWISIYSRFQNFSYGIFDISAILYYVSICFVFLFGTVRVYESRRWA